MGYSGYEMKYEGDCGVASMTAITGQPYTVIANLYPAHLEMNLRIDDLYDNYLVHWNILSKLKIPFREVSFDELISGSCISSKTIILIHAIDNPETWVPEDIAYQHYVVLNEVKDGKITVDWGYTPFIKTFTFEQFKQLYEGFPTQIAYTISGENLRTDLTKWEKIKLWIFLQVMKVIKVFIRD